MKNTFLHLTFSPRLLLFAAFLLPVTSCKDYDGGEPIPASCTGIHWEYEGIDGPDYWNQLCVDYIPCGGSVQSPVDVKAAIDDASLGEIAKTYAATATHILNNGHTLQFTCDAGSSIVVNGETYKLLQFHSHTHSEHFVNGASYPMELHFVHKNETTGKLAVIGIFVKEGAENAFLKPFIDHLPASKDGMYDAADTFNATDCFPADKSYFTYAGSLTTPPCSEIVTWIVMETPVEATADQIHHFEDIEHENARPVQPLYGRVIKHYKG